MALRTGLTWLQEKTLQKHFREKRLSLLYKASVHRFSVENLFHKCSDQGPTVTVMYNQNCVAGIFMSYSYLDKRKVPIHLFVLRENKISTCKLRPTEPSTLFDDSGARDHEQLKILLDQQKVTVSSDIRKNLGLPRSCTIDFEECEVFRCEALLDTKEIEGVFELKWSLLPTMRYQKLYGGEAYQARILLLGPIGGGKSSFFNSVKSVFRGHVTHQALVGSDASGISKQYRTYSIKDGNDGNSLPFILCDSLGLDENEGLCIEDVVSILKGHVPDRYQFNSTKPITPDHPDYIPSPLLKDKIHCVALVFDASTVEQLSDEMIAKIKSIQKQMVKWGVAHVVLLTHVDSIDLVLKGDFLDIYNCMPVKLKIEAVHRDLGFPLSDIFVVSNYVTEWELDPLKDVLILSALRHMLWAADDFLEDAHPTNRMINNSLSLKVEKREIKYNQCIIQEKALERNVKLDHSVEV